MSENFNLGESYLSFKTSDLDALAREILSDEVLEGAMKAALDEMEKQLKANFEERQANWTPLARSTQMQRARQGYGPTSPILVRSGTLRDNAAAGREVEVNNGEIRGDVFPNDDAKPEYGKSPIGDYMEALDNSRPFYDLSDEQLDKVYEVFEATLAKLMGAE